MFPYTVFIERVYMSEIKDNNMQNADIGQSDKKPDAISAVSKKYKEETCRVLWYNPKEKFLDVLFQGYGIRIPNAENFSGDTAVVKYKSDIGKKDFVYKL